MSCGYDKDRFVNLTGDQFDCVICQCIAQNPRECSGCGSLFCEDCIASWLNKKKECPNRCSATKEHITKITSRALLKIYNDLDVKCIHENCQKVVKLMDLESHENNCNKPKCVNFDICENSVQKELQDEKVCELPCLLLKQMRDNKQNPKQQLTDIKKFLNQYYNNPPPAQQQQLVQSVVQQPIQQQIANNNVGGGTQKVTWSMQSKGTNIELTQDRCGVWLKENAYMFRTIISEKPFYNGCHYWEIIADERTENELKIGVATKNDFNFNSAFCDYEFGYSFYGLGQLRHNSNASGPQYGKRFKKEGVLGCFLNMNKGQLSFALNGEFMGVAFSHDNLKKGPIVIAVSLLHCAGCRLDSSKPVPAYFPQ